MVRKFIFLVLLLACTAGVRGSRVVSKPAVWIPDSFPGWLAAGRKPGQRRRDPRRRRNRISRSASTRSMSRARTDGRFPRPADGHQHLRVLTVLLGTQPDVINGMAGVTHMYGGMANGHQVVIGSFYLVQEPYGFILSSMMLASQAKPLAAKADAVFKTFARIGSAPPPVAAAPAPTSPYDSSPLCEHAV